MSAGRVLLWSGCTSPETLTGLATGPHTFEVRASASGQTDATPAQRTWTVDPSVPIPAVPDADATLKQSIPDQNLGTTTELSADNSPQERSFLRFTVSGVPAGQSVLRATLRLYATNGSDNGPEIRPSASGWSETGVTWNNQPSLLGPLVADAAAVPAGAWQEYDLTGAVTGNGVYSFGVLPNSSNRTVFDSREGSHPQS